jgi:hypothetical protein
MSTAELKEFDLEHEFLTRTANRETDPAFRAWLLALAERMETFALAGFGVA